MKKVLELFGHSYLHKMNWEEVVTDQECPYLSKRCIKVRKSQPEISIGSCTVSYGKENEGVMICPFRLLERNQIFMDCIHLLNSHEPGNELHVIPEIAIPGGNVDYFLASVRDGKVKDFVGLELQTLDTTGTVWPARQSFLHEAGVPVEEADLASKKSYGMNWKMTAKTILVQLHHKVETFEHLNKHLVLVVQDRLLDYMKKEFSFDHLNNALTGDPMHFHSYAFSENGNDFKLSLVSRFSTDTQGIAQCLGLQSEANVDMATIIKSLEAKLSERTLLTIGV